MNNDTPRIAFAYPTFPRPGMSAIGPLPPDIGKQVTEFPITFSFFVSAGLILNSQKAYSFDVDVLFNGKSLIPSDTPAIDSQLMGTAVSNRDDFIATSTTLLPSIQAPSEGLYTIRVSLYAGDTEEKNRKLIEEYDCYFVLASNWISNEMSQTG